VDYHARVWIRVLSWLVLVIGLICFETVRAQDTPKPEPQYEDTFAGPVIELSPDKITVSRSILGKQPEKRTFLIKPDTQIEGKLRTKVKVTVGFVSTDDGDIARLIVVRPANKK
jgi:hypothetical protein